MRQSRLLTLIGRILIADGRRHCCVWVVIRRASATPTTSYKMKPKCWENDFERSCGVPWPTFCGEGVSHSQNFPFFSAHHSRRAEWPGRKENNANNCLQRKFITISTKYQKYEKQQRRNMHWYQIEGRSKMYFGQKNQNWVFHCFFIMYLLFSLQNLLVGGDVLPLS